MTFRFLNNSSYLVLSDREVFGGRVSSGQSRSGLQHGGGGCGSGGGAREHEEPADQQQQQQQSDCGGQRPETLQRRPQ